MYIAQNASLIGFTLTNGAGTTSGGSVYDQYTGAIYAPTAYANVSNCIITGNSGYLACIYTGARLLNCLIRGNKGVTGGALIQYGIVSNCTIAFNRSFANMVASCTVYQSLIVSNVCFYVDGSYTVVGGPVYNSIIGWNSGAYYAGGVGGADIYNCLIIGNSAGLCGGVWGGTLRNCTVVGNKTSRTENNNAGGVGRGAFLTNCIVWGNTNAGGVNYQNMAVADASQMTNSCTTPPIPGDPAGSGFITNNPLFVDQGSGFGTAYVLGNLRLSPSSPCVNTGTNQGWMTTTWPYDLDGRIRIRYGTVDMGCYERINSGTICGLR